MTDPTAAAANLLPCRIMQTEFGEYGNCQSACLAMMLGLPLSSVPNFSATPGDDNAKYAAQTAWLRKRGLWLLTIVKWQALPWPPKHGFYIAGGMSPRGNRHSVIFKDGELWHDPHPEGGGIADVQDVDFIMPIAWNTRPQPAPPAGEPDFEQLWVDHISEFGTAEGWKAAVSFATKMYRLGLAARPKVEDAEVAAVALLMRSRRVAVNALGSPVESIPDPDCHKAADLLERLARELVEERERTVSVIFPNHPLRGGVGREYTLDDIKPLLIRAEAAESKLAELHKGDVQRVKDISRLIIERDEVREQLAEREAELAKAYEAFLISEMTGTLLDDKSAELVCEVRHAARQQQKASDEKDEP